MVFLEQLSYRISKWLLLIPADSVFFMKIVFNTKYNTIMYHRLNNTRHTISSCRRKGIFLTITDSPYCLLDKRTVHRCFPVNFAKFLRTPFCIEQLRWLFLYFQHWTLIFLVSVVTERVYVK